MQERVERSAGEKILNYIWRNPGIHLRGIAKQLGLSIGAVEYHLHRLLRAGKISFIRSGMRKLYYTPMGIDARDVSIIALLRERIARKVILELLVHPGLRFTDIHANLGVSKSTLSFHISRMVKSDILVENAIGREKFFEVNHPEHITKLLVTFHETFLDDAVDRFIATWSGL